MSFENRNINVLLAIVGIAILIVSVTAATAAYFVATMSGSSASISATAANVGTLTHTAGSAGLTASTIFPGWSQTKSFTVKLTNATGTGVKAPYTCSLNTTGRGITDMYLKTTVSGGATSTYTTASQITSTGSVTIASGTLTPSAATHTIGYTLTFKETGTNQNTQQGATFSATVNCALTGTNIYYNNSNTGGTTTAPTAVNP